MSGFGRSGGGGFGGGRYRDDSYSGGESSVDMFVPAADCGKIIGRQGMKIRELQDASGAKITVSRDDEGDGTRRVALSGSEDSIAGARAMIMEILENGDRGGRQQSMSYGRGFDGGGSGGGTKEVIQIDSSLVGRLIGRGGSRIRELQDDTGCRISVSRDRGHGGQTEVELIGSNYNIRKAKDAIDELCNQVY